MTRDRRPSSRRTSASTRCGPRSSGSATSRTRSSRPAASGRWASACPPRSARSAGAPDRLVINLNGDGSFQQTMQAMATAVEEQAADQGDRPRQPGPRDGAPVAGPLLRPPLLLRRAEEPRLREARRGVRRRGFRVRPARGARTPRTRRRSPWTTGPALVHVRTDPNENCYPMWPAGQSIDTMVVVGPAEEEELRRESEMRHATDLRDHGERCSRPSGAGGDDLPAPARAHSRAFSSKVEEGRRPHLTIEAAERRRGALEIFFESN